MPKYILRDVPPDVWDAFHALCEARRESHKDALIRLMRREVAESKRESTTVPESVR